MALPQRHRLRGHRVFERIYRKAQRLHGTAMVLRVWPAEAPLMPPQERGHASSPWRCAVVVSAKVSKRAVQRNRLRRLLHAHLLEQPLAPEQPIWLLISLKPGSPDLPPEQLLGECRHLLHKAGLTP